MRYWRLIVIGVLGISLVASSTLPVAAAHPKPDAACDSTQQNGLVVTFADGTTASPNDTVTLYPGTTFRLILCSKEAGDWLAEPTGSAWSLESVDGLEQIAQNPKSITVRVTSDGISTQRDLTLENKVQGKESVNSPSITVFPGYTTSRSINDTDIEVRFANESAKGKFQTATAKYHTSVAGIQSNLSRLSNVSNGSVDVSDVNRTIAVAQSLNESIDRLNASHENVKGVLFSLAGRESVRFTINGEHSDAGEALERYSEHRQDVVNRTTKAIVEHRAKLANRAESAAIWIGLNFVGASVLGAVFGIGGGWFVTSRRLDEVEYQRSRTSAVDFHRKQIRGPVLLGVGMVLIALAMLVVLVGLGDLLAILQALI